MLLLMKWLQIRLGGIASWPRHSKRETGPKTMSHNPGRYEYKLSARVTPSAAEHMADPRHVALLLNNVCDICVMKPINVIAETVKGNDSPAQGAFSDVGGVTGYALLTTSHCSIHIWPTLRHVMVELCSCKPFSASILRDYVLDALGVEHSIFEQTTSLAADERE